MKTILSQKYRKNKTIRITEQIKHIGISPNKGRGYVYVKQVLKKQDGKWTHCYTSHQKYTGNGPVLSYDNKDKQISFIKKGTPKHSFEEFCKWI